MKKKKLRVIQASGEAQQAEIYSFFPIDRADCPCSKDINDWKVKLGSVSGQERIGILERVPYLACIRDKTGMKRYVVTCNKCGDTQGYCWATDDTLTDWCDFHYVQSSDGETWRGCFTPHISPITQQLCFECACGNDTRDFRANMTMKIKDSVALEKVTSIGRDLGQRNSKFKATILKK